MRLDLTTGAPDDVLGQLVSLLGLDAGAGVTLQKMLKRREERGSTGVGRGVAIPHARCALVDSVQLAFGRLPAGIPWSAIDDKPVTFFFLIVAPPLEVSNQYLPVLGRVAQFVKEPDVPQRLAGLQTVDEFIALLQEKGL